MKIRLFQGKPKIGDIAFNLQLCLKEIELAGKEKSNLICFPESFLSGYPIEDRLFYSDFKVKIEKAIDAVLQKSLQLPKLIIALPTPFFAKSGVFNSVLIISNGKILERVDKIHLPNYGVFDERRYFKPGKNLKLVRIAGKEVLSAICEDIWLDEYIKKAKALKPDLVIAINASPFERGKFEKRLEKMRSFSCEGIYLNQVLGHDELVFDGRSFGVSRTGKLTFVMKAFEEESLDYSLKTLAIKQENEIGVTYKALVFGLSEYCKLSGVNSVILGLSGGVDSALCAKIAIDAFGSSNVLPVFLPSHISSDESRKDASDFLKIHKLNHIELPIEGVFNETCKLFSQGLSRLARQNLQSRIRGTLLMALSNELGKMVITTGNKSELAIGYCTIYGDTNGAFNPIKDLLKTEVYEICEFLNSQKPTFPLNILQKAPTAELEKGQTDEASFGLPYPVLDFVLKELIEEKSLFETIAQKLENTGLHAKCKAFRSKLNLSSKTTIEIVEYVFAMLQKAQFKRSQAVCGTKVSKCAFGRDWRFGVNWRFGVKM